MLNTTHDGNPTIEKEHHIHHTRLRRKRDFHVSTVRKEKCEDCIIYFVEGRVFDKLKFKIKVI